MDKSEVPSMLPLCRLCGVLGHHKIDIFDEKSCPRVNEADVLSESILHCVDVRVEKNDETTKVCGYCFSGIQHFVAFREICAATNGKMQKSKRRRIETSGGVIDELIRTRGADDENANTACLFVSRNIAPLGDPSVECISLIEDPTADSVSMNCDDDDWHASNSIIHTENPITTGNAREQVLIMTEQQTGFIQTMKESHQYNVRNDSPVISLIEGEDDSSDPESIVARAQNIGKRNRSVSLEANKSLKKKAAKNVSTDLIVCRAPTGGSCKELFVSWDAMMCHVENYHAKGVKKTFCCHLCKKTFSKRGNLQQHMNSVHNREIRFICPNQWCAKIFTQKGDLERHTNAVHTKRVAYRCTKCPMKFYYKQSLTRHLASKHGVGLGMMFSCYLCKKASYGKRALRIHMNSLHTGQVRFVCPFPMCSKSFNQKCNLNGHTNAIHTKEIVFKCTECDKEFNYKSSLTKHIGNKH